MTDELIFVNVTSSDGKRLALCCDTEAHRRGFLARWPLATLATMTRDEIRAVLYAFHGAQDSLVS
ncbi:MAG: hypothetical protein A2Z31_07140 [candidate division NC10 bacterium RBG_16_65_8]|nr:MAG: hypothetical protein A2Z31_07140 [candidate division NC10 bacterium RBG_16_65_8]